MKTLGVDYGRSKVGLAIADGPLAEPLKVIRYKDIDELVKRIETEIEKESAEKIVVGISEGKMALESKKFSLSLRKKLNIAVETFDETLTSQDARRLSQEAGINRKKRKEMEDAYAAAIMLQNYLDSNL